MELQEAIKSRRNIRNFNPQLLCSSDLHEIIESAYYAPSAKNRKPWQFVVITNNNIKNKISKAMRKASDDLLLEEITTEYPSSVKNSAGIINSAPAIVMVYRNINDDFKVSDTLSIGGAVQNMLLTAASKGIGSLWIRDICYCVPEIHKILQDEFDRTGANYEHYINKDLIAAVAFGYEKAHKPVDISNVKYISSI